MNLHWHLNETLSGLHIAAAIAHGRSLADPRIAPVVAATVAALDQELGQLGSADQEDPWFTLCTHACQDLRMDQLIRAALPTAVSRTERRLERLVGLATELAAGIGQALPGMSEELRHRSRPLREHWEARGPGLMTRLRQLTDPRLTIDQATVHVVHPALGGGGGVVPARASVWIEALLANPTPQLPEVVRLGWLLGQLACFRLLDESYATAARPPRQVVAWALVPATLAAAETVELAVCDARTVEQAMLAWQSPQTGAGSFNENQAQRVWDWWQTDRQVSSPADRPTDSWFESLVDLARRLA